MICIGENREGTFAMGSTPAEAVFLGEELVWGALLPKGYRRCLFLETSGKQYINTGIQMHRIGVWKLRIQFTKHAGAFQDNGVYYGDGKTVAIKAFDIGIGSGGSWFWRNGGSGINGTQADLRAHTFVVNHLNGTVTMDNAIVTEVTDAVSAVYTGCLYLAARNASAGTAGNFAAEKIYAHSIAGNNGRVIQNFIPALDARGVPCMFDTMTNTPFYNSGNGVFGYETLSGAYTAPI